MPAKEELPSTLRRSPARAWEISHDAAVESYGEGERAHRTAFSALKHEYEKVGDRWWPKGRRGPSDAQAARTRPREGYPFIARRRRWSDVSKPAGVRDLWRAVR